MFMINQNLNERHPLFHSQTLLATLILLKPLLVILQYFIFYSKNFDFFWLSPLLSVKGLI